MTIRPFLKWPGSKYQIVTQLLSHLPQGKRLIEPFVGSGSVFLNASHRRYLLAERNQDLVTLYRYLKRDREAFINYCQGFFVTQYNNKAHFYELRQQFNDTRDQRLKSALFLYLNRHGYNGLCRYNLKGQFNVPFGYYQKPYFPHKELVHCYKKLRYASLKCVDYKKTHSWIEQDDVVYCDPPYTPLSKSANFTQYSPHQFGWQDHVELAAFAKDLASQGIPVLVSNHDTADIRQLYEGADIATLQVRRSISCLGDKRSTVSEILALFHH